jgi:hypothetical protein
VGAVENGTKEQGPAFANGGDSISYALDGGAT